MGVGSSREIEEQLEAALSLLDAARAKQEQLVAESENLQRRIQSQAATLLQEEQSKQRSSIHLVQEREPWSKRVMFGLLVTTPLALHNLASAVAIEIVDSVALAYGALLCGAVLLLLRFRRYRWRRIRPERIVHAGEPPGSPRQSNSVSIVDGGASTVAPPSVNTSALLASEAELACIAQVKAGLRRDPPKEEQGGGLLPDHEPLLDLQLIRFLREHGENAGKIEGCYRRALEWRSPSPSPSP